MLVGKYVKHSRYGIGVITEHNELYVNVAFKEELLSRVTINHSQNYMEKTGEIEIVNIKLEELEVI